MQQMPPEPCTGEGLVVAFRGVNGCNFGEDAIARAMLCAHEVSIAHKRHIVALHSIDAMQNIVLRLYLCQNDIADLQVIRLNERHIIHAALDERSHADAGGRKNHLLAFAHQARNLGDKYLVRQLHQRVAL